MNASPPLPRIALVTGGATRVGAVLVRALLHRGYDVIIHANTHIADAAALVDEAHSLHRRAWSVQADLCEPSQRESLIRSVLEIAENRLDVLVHNAGLFLPSPAHEPLEPGLHRLMELHVTAPFALTRAFATALRIAQGAVVAIGCTSALRMYPRFLSYSVSKAAQLQMMQGLALELAPDVRVNVVAPGLVLPAESESPEQLRTHLNRVPLHRIGAPEHVAQAVLALIENTFVTGVCVPVDGGRSVQ